MLLGQVHRPRRFLVDVGPGPCFELFIYVDDVDRAANDLQRNGAPLLKAPEDIFWGERVAYVSDPDGNPVALAAPGATRSES